MNRIERLIEEYCPDGVEYKKLTEVCTISRGRVLSKQYIRENAGDYPVYSSQTVNDGVLGKINSYEYDGEYITWTTDGANAGSVFYRKGKFNITNVCGLLDINSNSLTIKFLTYWLELVAKNYVNEGMGNPKLMSHTMSEISIPIPPLPIQQEIVNILDNFTQLEAELEAELEARRKQYEFYLNQLMEFEGKEVEWKTIKDLYDFKNGLNKGKKYFGKGTPIVNFTDVYNNRSICATTLKGKVEVTSNEKLLYGAQKNDIFFTRTSETQEDIGMTAALIDDIKECVFSGFILRARPKTNLLNPKFISLYLSTYTVRKNIIRNSSFTTRALTSGPRLSKIKIPLLPLSEQERIVSILDKFDALVNDNTIGLQAEIDARRKQYEYYRNKLLTFAEYE